MATNGMRITGYQQPVNLIEIAGRKETATRANNGSFQDMFSRELAQTQGIQFSKHAQQRLHSRGLELSDRQLADLAGAIDRAQAKGSRETLVLADEAAFVVSVPNRTVVTVFDRESLQDGVVTSIDSAVII